MKMGVFVRPQDMNRLDEAFAPLRDAGFTACQLGYKPEVFRREDAQAIRAAADRNGIEISAHFVGYRDGFSVYDLRDAFLFDGLTASTFRAQRLEYLMRGAEFVSWLGITDMIIHAGFIPNNPFDPDYAALVGCIRLLGERAKALGVNILFETGAESPVSLLRLIRDAGTGNLYVNFDTGNAILYGFTDPVAALYTIGDYVRNIHVKDGMPPTDCDHLGRETAMGDGLVDFKRIAARLKALGYDRFLIIERELGGDRQREDILRAKAMLEELFDL